MRSRHSTMGSPARRGRCATFSSRRLRRSASITSCRGSLSATWRWMNRCARSCCLRATSCRPSRPPLQRSDAGRAPSADTHNGKFDWAWQDIHASLYREGSSLTKTCRGFRSPLTVTMPSAGMAFSIQRLLFSATDTHISQYGAPLPQRGQLARMTTRRTACPRSYCRSAGLIRESVR
jgi:hypothetical protein